jgi:transcriptional regulator with XRE-family HTH domain
MTTGEQAARLVQVLKILLRFSKVSNREVEKKLELSAGYMSRLLSGRIDLKLSHVFEMADVLELHPHELFEIALPPSTPGPSRGLRQLRRLVPHLVPLSAGAGPFSPPSPLELTELRRRLSALADSLRRVVSDLDAAVQQAEGFAG